MLPVLPKCSKLWLFGFFFFSLVYLFLVSLILNSQVLSNQDFRAEPPTVRMRERNLRVSGDSEALWCSGASGFCRYHASLYCSLSCRKKSQMAWQTSGLGNCCRVLALGSDLLPGNRSITSLRYPSYTFPPYSPTPFNSRSIWGKLGL